MAKAEQTRTLMRRAHAARHQPKTPDYPRPKTRGDCVDGPRPCPFVGCRHNLLLEVTPTGSLRYPFDMPWEVTEDTDSCALDVADEGEHAVGDVAQKLGSCREVADRGLASALRKLAAFKDLQDGSG